MQEFPLWKMETFPMIVRKVWEGSLLPNVIGAHRIATKVAPIFAKPDVPGHSFKPVICEKHQHKNKPTGHGAFHPDWFFRQVWHCFPIPRKMRAVSFRAGEEGLQKLWRFHHIPRRSLQAARSAVELPPAQHLVGGSCLSVESFRQALFSTTYFPQRHNNQGDHS